MSEDGNVVVEVQRCAKSKQDAQVLFATEFNRKRRSFLFLTRA